MVQLSSESFRMLIAIISNNEIMKMLFLALVLLRTRSLRNRKRKRVMYTSEERSAIPNISMRRFLYERSTLCTNLFFPCLEMFRWIRWNIYQSQMLESDKPRYHTRKNEIATNMLGVCSQDLQFIYIYISSPVGKVLLLILEYYMMQYLGEMDLKSPKV